VKTVPSCEAHSLRAAQSHRSRVRDACSVRVIDFARWRDLGHLAGLQRVASQGYFPNDMVAGETGFEQKVELPDSQSLARRSYPGILKYIKVAECNHSVCI
jgi:hypothetical protein